MEYEEVKVADDGVGEAESRAVSSQSVPRVHRGRLPC